jgi:hypothetical protein
MRTIAELPYPAFKLTLFGMNQKFILKFEQGPLEQVYKVSEMDVTGGVDGVFQLVDDVFIKAVETQFECMRSAFKDCYNRHEY